jgi:hypothetical protein
VRDLRADNSTANTKLLDKQTIIEGLDKIIIQDNQELSKLGKQTLQDIAGERASSAEVVLSRNPTNPSGEYIAAVINTGKNNMYEVSVRVQELIESNEDLPSTIAKINRIKTYYIPMLRGNSFETPVKLEPFAVPPNGAGIGFDVTSKGGGTAGDTYRRVKTDNGFGVQLEHYRNGKLVSTRLVTIGP